MSGGTCIEFRNPKDDGEFDLIIQESKEWLKRAATGKLPPELAKLRPKSPIRFARAFVASKLMVAGYRSYDVEGNEIVPTGEPEPALTLEEWLEFARDRYRQFDAVMDMCDAETVRAVSVKRDEEFEAEGKG